MCCFVFISSIFLFLSEPTEGCDFDYGHNWVISFIILLCSCCIYFVVVVVVVVVVV